MAQLPLFRCQKNDSPNAAAVAPADGASSAAVRQCLPSCGGIRRRLVRRLKKQSRMLCTAATICGTSGGGGGGGGGGFQCQYDPLSYSRNFDGHCALDDDSSHFHCTFSSRFARPLAASH